MSVITLDELIALNDEIAALVRAGVPLEQGLAELGGDLPGRLGQFTAALAQRTARGESLAQAMRDDRSQLPSAYRAVVEAGIRAGRLPAALEAVAAAARRQRETQRAVGIAVMYPLLVVLVAWCGMMFFMLKIVPSFEKIFKDFGIALTPLTGAWMQVSHFIVNYWFMLVLLLLLAPALVFYLLIRHFGWSDRLLDWVPWMGRMLRCSRTATFLEVLALLVENETPLPEAVVLAAEASGDPPTMRAARQLADAIQNGRSLDGGAAAFSPLIAWLVLAAGRDNALLLVLRHAATAYHRRARHQADMARLLLPVLLTVLIGGTVTMLYGLTLFIPYTEMLHALGR